MHKLIVLVTLLAACGKGKTTEQKASEAKVEEGGDGTRMALEEGKKAGPKAQAEAPKAPAVTPIAIANDADLEAKLLDSYTRTNQMLVAGVNRNCDELAVDLVKQRGEQQAVMAGIAAYAKAHPDAFNAIDTKLKPKTDKFMKTAEPTFAHCTGNKAFLEAVTAPSEGTPHP